MDPFSRLRQQLSNAPLAEAADSDLIKKTPKKAKNYTEMRLAQLDAKYRGMPSVKSPYRVAATW